MRQTISEWKCFIEPFQAVEDLERRHQAGARLRRGSEGHDVRAVPSNPLAGSLIESLRDAQALAERTFRPARVKHFETPGMGV
jgi:hypothetical protein